jgi:Na+/H+ antiporter NhaD/arsenite permease-like protein
MIQYFVLFIFVLSYLLFAFLPSKRTIVGVFSSLILLILCYYKFDKFLITAIDYNVINIFLGTMLVSNLVAESGIAEYIAESIIIKTRSIKWSFLLLCIICGLLSMFLENVATLIIVAPVAIQIAKKLSVDPTKIVFALAVTSNLQGTATLIGDPPSMLLASATGMTFLDFFVYKLKPSIFFAVQIGAIPSFFVLYYIFNKYKAKSEMINYKMLTKVKSWAPLYILVSMIIVLMITSIFKKVEDNNYLFIAGMICLFFGFLALLVKKIFLKTSILEGLKLLDWETAIFLASVFVIVKSLEIVGVIDLIAEKFLTIVGVNNFLIYTLFVFFSVLVSGFVDNVPFFATMIPVAKIISSQTNISLELLLFGLLIGSTLGGNITPIGASANIVGWGMVKKEGYNATFLDFVKIGFPFTIAAVVPAYIFIWFVWK